MSDRSQYDVPCIHSSVVWWCLGCVQGQAHRVERENKRLRAKLEQAKRAETLLSLLLSATLNHSMGDCPSDPCAYCTVGEAAQAYLNDLEPEKKTGWWWVEDDAEIVRTVEHA